jgi:hypothetical protein
MGTTEAVRITLIELFKDNLVILENIPQSQIDSFITLLLETGEQEHGRKDAR